MSKTGIPRCVIAGLAGDTGKTMLSLGIIGALTARDLSVAAFKKGPDFIDAAWLGTAAGSPGRNLDTFMMPRDSILSLISQAGAASDVIVVEGNRGLFDGFDSHGVHSTAQLAGLIEAPVILVVDATKVTRTIAAMVIGCRTVDPYLNLVGVVLNRVGTPRQESVIRSALKAETGLPVLGAIPRIHEQLLPSRHLGLVTEREHPETREVLDRLTEVAQKFVDLDAILALATGAGPLGWEPEEAEAPDPPGPTVRIGVLWDDAFSFYYPDNLTALRSLGAELVPISSLTDEELPSIDALYAGGGFPEIHATELSANIALRRALYRVIADGIPVWAECGGLMYLAESLSFDGRTFPMVGALPIDVEQDSRPQGHGYVQAQVDSPNQFFPEGTEILGHEFHYSRVKDQHGPVDTIMHLDRGVGVGNSRDGIRIKNVIATYTHLHALGTPAWAHGLVNAARGSGP